MRVCHDVNVNISLDSVSSAQWVRTDKLCDARRRPWHRRAEPEGNLPESGSEKGKVVNYVLTATTSSCKRLDAYGNGVAFECLQYSGSFSGNTRSTHQNPHQAIQDKTILATKGRGIITHYLDSGSHGSIYAGPAGLKEATQTQVASGGVDQ